MEGGQLLDYLHSEKDLITLFDMIHICYDVVKGCAYLEKMKFVHRDLAARNCMLTSKNPLLRKVRAFHLEMSFFSSDRISYYILELPSWRSHLFPISF